MNRTTDGRYSSRNSTIKVDCQRIEDDVIKNKEASQDSLNAIDESLRSVPESVEIMIMRKDSAGVKDVLALAGVANEEAERLKKKKDDIDQRFERVRQSKPTKGKHFADHYSSLFNLGAEYINLNQEAAGSASTTIGQMTEILNRDSKTGAAT